jgi:hypothetical protein
VATFTARNLSATATTMVSAVPRGRSEYCSIRSAARLASGGGILRFSDQFLEHLPHRTRIAAHDGCGSGDVAVGVQVLPVENVAGVAGELLEESALGPAVAFAERVDGVDLAELARPVVDVTEDALVDRAQVT